jgi:hypothetical protein
MRLRDLRTILRDKALNRNRFQRVNNIAECVVLEAVTFDSLEENSARCGWLLAICGASRTELNLAPLCRRLVYPTHRYVRNAVRSPTERGKCAKNRREHVQQDSIKDGGAQMFGS